MHGKFFVLLIIPVVGLQPSHILLSFHVPNVPISLSQGTPIVGDFRRCNLRDLNARPLLAAVLPAAFTEISFVMQQGHQNLIERIALDLIRRPRGR